MAKARRANLPSLIRSGITGFRHMTQTVFSGQSADFKILLWTVIFMTGAGAVMVFSSSYIDSVIRENNVFGELQSQLFGIVGGAFLLIVFAFLKPATIQKLANWGLVLGLSLQAAVIFTGFGASVNGNRNWLDLGFVTVQPSEFIKIAMIVYLANLISVERLYAREDYRFWMVPTGVFAVIAIFVGVLGSDAGTTIIMAFILFGMYYMGGLPWRYVTLLSIVAVIAMPLLMISNASRRGRVMAWLFPSAPDPNGYNWQSEHAKWAFASGGPFGVGLGNSKMKWSWLPEAQNDFIFAIIGEEWGMVGALFTIGLFISLGIVLFRIAKKTNDPYQRLVVYGVTFWIMGQAFINMSVVLTMFPVLGVNLPLISAGGSSILATLIAIGIVLGIERNNSISPSKRLVRSGVRR
jgi:cell division protein FtsW